MPAPRELQKTAAYPCAIATVVAAISFLSPPGYSGAAFGMELNCPASQGVNPELQTEGSTYWTTPTRLGSNDVVFVSAHPPRWMQGKMAHKVLRTLAGVLGGHERGRRLHCLNGEVRQLLQAFVAKHTRSPHIIWSPDALTARLSRQVLLEAMIDLGTALARQIPCKA